MSAPDPATGRKDHRPSPLDQAVALQKSSDQRDRTGLFFIEGVRNFVQAVDHGFDIRHIIASEKLLINPLARKLARQRQRAGVPVFRATPEQFRHISTTKRASGIAAIARQRWQSLETAPRTTGRFWCLLHSVQSPGNLGTLIRTSNAVGGAGFIFTGPAIAPYHPAIIRAAMGATFEQSFIRTDWRGFQAWLADQPDLHVIGATPDGTVSLHDITRPVGTPILILGEERKGLTPEQKALCATRVRIPMSPGTDSLNLGVAGSLLMYELLRAGDPVGTV